MKGWFIRHQYHAFKAMSFRRSRTWAINSNPNLHVFFFFFCQKLNWNETGVLKLLAQVWDSLLEWILFHENYVSPLPPKRNWSWRYGCQQLELIVFPESDNPEHGYYQPSYISPKFSAHTSILITAFMKIGKCGVWGVFYDLLTFFFFDQIRLGKGEARFNTLG